MEEHCDDIHEKYVPNHICINQAVDYSGFGRIPTHGPHRPNWASFGEYRYCSQVFRGEFMSLGFSYLPMERWQHNLEHGCIVLLYHPCLDQHEVGTIIHYSLTPPPQVTTVKRVLSGCLRKHIITPSRLPTLSRPVILIAWGFYLEFQFKDLSRMKSFISTHALGGPEGNYSKDGLYTHLQMVKAEIPAGSDKEDFLACSQL